MLIYSACGTYGPVLNPPNQFAVTQEIEVDMVVCFDNDRKNESCHVQFID